MRSSSTFDPQVAAFLDDEAGSGSPDYLDDILRVTAAARQRRTWTSIERWLPMDIAGRRPVIGPAIPWRAIGAFVVLALLLAAIVAVTVGSRNRLAPPNGLAANGVVVYGADGDIHAFDPSTGETKTIIAGQTNDETPDFSPDGSRLVFAREGPSNGRFALMLANADGTGVRPLTDPGYPTWNVWSPDGTRIAVVDTSHGVPTLSIVDVDGRPPVVLDVGGLKADRVAWRPDGTELVFTGTKPGSVGLYAVKPDGTGFRPIRPSTAIDTDWMEMELSPDGAQIEYTRWTVDRPFIHVVDVETGTDRTLAFDGQDKTTADGWARWSADGTRLVFTRLATPANHLAVGPAEGGAVVEIGPSFKDFTNGVQPAFSPDGTKVVAQYGFDHSTWILDASGGPGTKLADGLGALATWQRRAP